MKGCVLSSLKTMSMPVVMAAAEGLGWPIVRPDRYLVRPDNYDSVVCYGILRGHGDAIRDARKKGKPFYHIDHAYIGACRDYRISSGSWFRVTKNGLQATVIKDRDDTRTKMVFRGELSDWRVGGDNYAVLLPSHHTANFSGIGKRWENDMRSLPFLRHAVFFEKGAKAFDFSEPWTAIISYNSTACVSALARGIPVYQTYGICQEVSGNLLQMKPWTDDRSRWANHVSWSQFTLEEIANGFAFTACPDETA